MISISSVLPSYSQVCLMRNGRSSSRIILKSNSRTNRIAANLIRHFFYESTQYYIPILVKAKPQKNDFIIGGEGGREIRHDGFFLSTKSKTFNIMGKDNGVIYGAVTFLERYMDMNYWGDHEYSLHHIENLQISRINYTENPTFKYRQTQCYALEDTVYRWWNKLEAPNEFFAATYWVHTENLLVPVDEYGRSHPEYYAYYNGQRHAMDIIKNPVSVQLCLSNKNVFNIIVHRIDSIFKKNPSMNMIAVSQNDNQNYCKCSVCNKINKEEGSPAGSIIRFVNAVAAKFPNKKIVTLAYQYSKVPPLHIKPAHNVIIMLCNIECSREVPLTDNYNGQNFIKILKQWSRITNNIFLWDYGINFSSYLFPFPNFHILQKNIQLFHRNKVTMHFSEIESVRGGDFAELRAYMISKLMWNDKLDVDSLEHHFLNGYYGKAGIILYDYIKLLEKSLIKSGVKLNIYGAQWEHLKGMFSPTLMKQYNQMFDKAEALVINNLVLLKRVQRSRLSLQYMNLEINRHDGFKDYDKAKCELELFEKRIKEFKMENLGEQYSPLYEYCESYRRELLKHAGNKI